MLKALRIIQWLLPLALLLCCDAFALERIRVVILPFQVHSLEDRAYLQNELPKVIEGHLKKAGAIVIPAPVFEDDAWKAKLLDTNWIQGIGMDSEANVVIWGSITWIGDKYSIDAKMIGSFSELPPSLFFVEGQGVENLLGSLKVLADNISLKLFKREKVAKITIVGNNRIEKDAIQNKIKTKPGDVFLAQSISEDLKSIYAMGYFDDIRIESEDTPEGKIIIFNVKEKPTIRTVRIKGNRAIKDDEIKENLTLRSGSILNIFQIQNNIKRIEELYHDKNYHNVKVTYQTTDLKQNQSDLDFMIEEGKKVKITSVQFIGNSAFSDKKLKKNIKTSKKGLFSWFTSSGELNMEDLSQDVARLTAFYHNNGYIDAKVGEPEVKIEGSQIQIIFKIEEGPQFKVGKVDVEGDLLLPRETILKTLKITQQTYYNRDIIRSDILLLTDAYSDEGYANTDVAPRIRTDPDKKVVDITYDINKGSPVYFEKIIISGNSRTRDKVIRRQLRVYEQELYSGRRLKRSVRNLIRLDYFEDVKVDTIKGSADDKMILKVEVKEKNTGAFSIGGGYSSIESAYAQGSISQRNFLGRGQTLRLNLMVGGRTQRINLGFTEPWLFDIPLSAGIDLTVWDFAYDQYDKSTVGGKLRFSYPVWNYTRAYLAYKLEKNDISNIDPFASDSIKELEGKNLESSISGALRYDSRDRAFLTSRGQNHSISLTHAGGLLGGDIAFTKTVGELSIYYPLFWKLVGSGRFRGGYVVEGDGGILPDYEKFYLGGIDTVRGYDWQDISAFDDDGNKVGGEKMLLFNLELTFPLVPQQGVYGVAFFDAGDVYRKDDSFEIGNLRRSTGAGIRWLSPVGPIRLEYGFVINPQPGDPKGSWEFGMGSTF